MRNLFKLAIVCACIGVANAQETPNREAEVNALIAAINRPERGEVVQAAQYIYVSGLSDRSLAEAVNQRLLRDYPRLREPHRVRFIPGAVVVVTRYPTYGDGFYGIALTRALSSFGIPEFASTLQEVGRHPKKGGSPADRVRKSALAEAKQIEWHRRKNQIISDSTVYFADEEPEVSRLIALLQSDDAGYQALALEWLDSKSVVNERMFAIIDRQVANYARHAEQLKSKADLKAISRRLHILSRSKNTQFKQSIESVLQSNAHPTIKRRAQAALAGIYWTETAETDDEGNADEVSGSSEDSGQ